MSGRGGDRITSGRRFLWVACALALLAAPGLEPRRVEAADPAPKLRNILIDPPSGELSPGEVVELHAVAEYDDGSTRDVTSETVFTSRDPEVIAVTGRFIRAVGGGETSVRARHTPTGQTADDPAEFTVFEITALTITPAHTTVAVGATFQMRALATLSNGDSGIDVTALMEWESKKTSVASIVGGLVTGLSLGQAPIEARDPASGTRSEKNAAIVEVTSGGGGPVGEEIEDLDATPLDTTLLVGESVDLEVIATFEGGATRDVTKEVTYSAKQGVVTIDSNGRVTAVGPGKVEISIRHSSGVGVTRKPDVWVGAVDQIDLVPESPQIGVGESLAMRALATYDNGRSRDITHDVTWSSNQPQIATVSDVPDTRGRLTGVALGTAVITARDRATGLQSRRSEGEVRVGTSPGTPPPAEDIRDLVVEPAILRLLPGQSSKVKVIAVGRDGSMSDVTARAQLAPRDPDIASAEGDLITALKGGHTEIRAYDPVSNVRSRTRGRVDVARLLNLRIDPAESALGVGQTTQLHALADFDDGSHDVDVTGQVRWRSEKPQVAAVDDGAARGRLVGVAKGSTSIRVEDPLSGARSDGSTGDVRVGNVPPENPTELVALSFVPPLLTLAPGEGATVAVFGVLQNGTKVALPLGELRLTSQTRRTVSIGRDGVIFGRRGGDGTVLVQHRPSDVTAELPVAVREVSYVAIDPGVTGVRVGDSVNLRALATFNDGTVGVDVTSDVIWRSRDPEIASVDDSAIKGRVTGIIPGVATIEARHSSSRVRSDPSTGIVRIVDGLDRVIVDPAEVALEINGTKQMRALGQFSDGSVLDISSGVTWVSSNPARAKVGATGLVTALAKGDLRIDAVDTRTGVSSATSSSGALVRVGKSLLGLQVSSDDDLPEGPVLVTMASGETAQLFGLGVFDETEEPVDLSEDLEWATSDAAVVSVTDRGQVTCLALGSATISVKDPNTDLTSTGTLGDATVQCSGAVVALRIEPATANLDYPKSRQMRAFRVFADGHESEVTDRVLWTTSDPDALSVVETGGNGGRVTALDDGIITVSALDPAFDLSSNDPGGTNGVVTVRKTRVLLEIFPAFPQPGADGIYRLRVGEILRLQARVTYASGATQGVNILVEWSADDPTVVLMGEAASLPVNNGAALKPGTTHVTARWPADEFSAELTDEITVAVSP